MRPSRWQRHIDGLDPETDFREIYRTLTLYEFPWDLNQSLSLALFRTYAVPSIGGLLDRTGEFTTACQRRYDDTAVLLEAPLVHGFTSVEGRTGIRRINQMHRMYDIADDDLRYVLATFVVVPARWLDDHGWRRLTPRELRASVNYYRALGRHLGISGVPETYEGFASLMDDYEAEHVAFDAGGRRVADATLDLLASFYPAPVAPLVRLFSRALLDAPLLEAFGYDVPGPWVRAASRAALRVRAHVVARLPARHSAVRAAQMPRIADASTPLAARGTFAPAVPPERGSAPTGAGG